MIELPITSTRREEFIDITSSLAQLVSDSGITDGCLVCFVPHTTAGITINENADPDVTTDLLGKLGRMIPQEDGYHHAEGNSDAHLKSSLVGCSLTIPFESGRLLLGTWQAVFFCEFDGPRNRRLTVRVSAGA